MQRQHHLWCFKFMQAYSTRVVVCSNSTPVIVIRSLRNRRLEKDPDLIPMAGLLRRWRRGSIRSWCGWTRSWPPPRHHDLQSRRLRFPGIGSDQIRWATTKFRENPNFWSLSSAKKHLVTDATLTSWSAKTVGTYVSLELASILHANHYLCSSCTEWFEKGVALRNRHHSMTDC